MKRGAVIIGVNKTGGGMPVLSAAVSSAEEFGAWAESQGCDIKLLVDEPGSVSADGIKTAIKHFVDKKTYDQLIVFFSGHGFLKGPGTELWILPGAPDDAGAAVNVRGSIELARYSGIPHIVIVSDACRTIPHTSRWGNVEGTSVFPNVDQGSTQPEIDVFYATRPGDAALEVRDDPDKSNEYKALFTECLLKGLKGDDAELFEEVEDPKRWVVYSFELKKYLNEEVPAAAGDVSITLEQDPEIRVESHPPNFLAELPSLPSGGQPTRPRTRGPKPPDLDDLVGRRRESEYRGGTASISPDLRNLEQESGFGPAMERIRSARGRRAFETATGFTVLGAEVVRAVTTRGNSDLFEEDGAPHVRVYPDPSVGPQTTLIQTNDGTGIALAVLPEFIGTVVIEEDRVVTVNYTPSATSDRYSEFESVAEEVEKRRAFAAVAARHGALRLNAEDANYLRTLKSIDPTLGIYAAYAYADVGARDNVQSVYRYMDGDNPYMPFDVALLARKLRDTRSPYDHFTPFCPMLTQGWSLLEPYRDSLAPSVREAGRHLVPSLWTTFSPEGVDILWKAIEEGDLS